MQRLHRAAHGLTSFSWTSPVGVWSVFSLHQSAILFHVAVAVLSAHSFVAWAFPGFIMSVVVNHAVVVVLFMYMILAGVVGCCNLFVRFILVVL